MLLQHLGNEYKLPTRNSEEPKLFIKLKEKHPALFEKPDK